MNHHCHAIKKITSLEIVGQVALLQASSCLMNLLGQAIQIQNQKKAAQNHLYVGAQIYLVHCCEHQAQYVLGLVFSRMHYYPSLVGEFSHESPHMDKVTDIEGVDP